jgi:hypothetical protein
MSAQKILQILSKLDNVIESGGGANLRATVARMAASGSDTNDIYNILRKSASSGVFTGKFNAPEKQAIRRIVDETVGSWSSHLKTVSKSNLAQEKERAQQLFDAWRTTSANSPLIFNEANPFSNRMRSLGFSPLPGQNYNKPGIVTKLTKSSAFPEYTPEFTEVGARNLIAAYNLDPIAAQEYSQFYPRVSSIFDTLSERTGIPKDRLAKVWAITSAQAEPGDNARKTIGILKDPESYFKGFEKSDVPITNERDFRLSLQAAAGELDDPEVWKNLLGSGKRANFRTNSFDPNDINAYTADTRDAQAVQGLINTYKVAPFAGQFDPSGPRYELYTSPGRLAAERLGLIPNQLQAGAWGNIRNFAGKETDFDPSTFDSLTDLSYNEDLYKEVLKRIRGM